MDAVTTLCDPYEKRSYLLGVFVGDPIPTQKANKTEKYEVFTRQKQNQSTVLLKTGQQRQMSMYSCQVRNIKFMKLAFQPDVHANKIKAIKK